MGSFTQVNGEFRFGIYLACWLGGERAQQRNSGTCQYFSPKQSCPSSPRPKARQFSFSLYVSGAFQATAPALELRVSEFASVRVGPLRPAMPRFPAAFGLTQPQSLLILITESYGNFSSQHWSHWLESLVSWDPSLLRGDLYLRYSSRFLPTASWVWY